MDILFGVIEGVANFLDDYFSHDSQRLVAGLRNAYRLVHQTRWEGTQWGKAKMEKPSEG
jgi:hypothetical protein